MGEWFRPRGAPDRGKPGSAGPRLAEKAARGARGAEESRNKRLGSRGERGDHEEHRRASLGPSPPFPFPPLLLAGPPGASRARASGPQGAHDRADETPLTREGAQAEGLSGDHGQKRPGRDPPRRLRGPPREIAAGSEPASAGLTGRQGGDSDLQCGRIHA